MGMAEAVIFPVASILTVMWYTNSEQVVRLAFWNNQVNMNPQMACFYLVTDLSSSPRYFLVSLATE